jgi:hypothetical protein
VKQRDQMRRARERKREDGDRETERDEQTPLLASPQGGVAERSIKMPRQHPLKREDGVVYRPYDRKTTPSASALVASQSILMTQPPLLAVMQGGEFAFAHSLLSHVLSPARSLTRSHSPWIHTLGLFKITHQQPCASQFDLYFAVLY